MDGRGHKLKQVSSAKSSVENVLTVLKKFLNVDAGMTSISIPGGIPIDGPSAGIAIPRRYTPLYSTCCEQRYALTGEISIRAR